MISFNFFFEIKGMEKFFRGWDFCVRCKKLYFLIH